MNAEKNPMISEELPKSQTNIQFCFGNDVIRARIMDFTLKHNPLTNQGAKEILALRTVNKSMNVFMLSEYRHRSLSNKISFNSSSRDNAPWDFDLLAEEQQLHFFKINVNKYRVKLSELSNFCRFFNYHRIHPMNDGAEIQVSDICTRYPHLNKFIHKEIIETLYGSKKSRNFVTMKKLEYGFPDGKVYQTIELSIRIQNEIIERFIDTTTQDENMKTLAEFIRSNFIAKNIIFGMDTHATTIIPVDFFSLFINQWSAKSAEIKLCWDNEDASKGTHFGRFSDLIKRQPDGHESAIKWSVNSIELLTRNEGLDNMISNFRKIMPSKKIVLDNVWMFMHVPNEWAYPRKGLAQDFVMNQITNYATDGNFSNFELEIAVPADATFAVDKLCGMLRQLGRSWEVRETIYGKEIWCRCGRRWTTYAMANNRIQGRLNISMIEYIPNSRFRCHSGFPYSTEPSWSDDEDE
ncbi:hypothetical protein L5515_016598 [Caenorhabditis briggsae]|uniref:Uncharacterized protein n=1 Tax=Caenorhabditis briggsae TaxID=6238 RepID=A0AAE9F771_CAEBR|nr:hypothetical protein L5515_016598 [Caenorhabditis briggsae]